MSAAATFRGASVSGGGSVAANAMAVSSAAAGAAVASAVKSNLEENGSIFAV